MRNKLSKIISGICVLIGAVLYALFGYRPTAVEPVPNINEPVQTEISIPVEQQTITAEASDAFYAQQGLEIPARIQQRSERIMQRTNYTVSFNTKWNIPNWVAWDITKEEVNNDRYQRNDFFVSDPDIAVTKAVAYEDYSGSGYDRGHMCPAGDNHFDATAMDECFYMTNICPQNHELNKESWNDLEMACRRWARHYGKV
ncbi:MAG: DNA/RNA non-specific endonuclease, partial [Bacteroidaceae bacterium]|nr:DNA/RNA non-specific endonuclease [Bacteroidaceae bacterium]